MKVAVASLGTVPEAWVGTRFGRCSQFLVFDLDTMEYVVVSIPPHQEEPDKVSLAAIQAVAQQGVSAVITGEIKPICRQTLFSLGIDIIDGVEGLTVQEAIDRYRRTGMESRKARKGLPARVAVVAQDGGLEDRLRPHFGACTSFLVVDPQTMEWEAIQVKPAGEKREANLRAIRAIVQSGATSLITPHIPSSCCLALQALAVAVYVAPEGITIREAVERYRRGELEERSITSFQDLDHQEDTV